MAVKKERIVGYCSPELKYALDVYAATKRTTTSELILNGLLATIPDLQEVYNEFDKYDKFEAATEDDATGGGDSQPAPASSEV